MKTTSKLHEVITAATELAPSTRARYLRDLDVFIEFAGAEPTGWTGQVVDAFHDKLVNSAIAPVSVKRAIASVNTALRLLVESTIALTEAQAVKMLASCDSTSMQDIRDRALLVVALETGMRQHSMLSMQIEHTHLRKRPPYVLTARQGDTAPMAVALSDVAVFALRPWHNLIDARPAASGPLFPVKPLSQRAMSRTAIQKILVRRGRAAGIERLTFGMLRASFIAWRPQLSQTELAMILTPEGSAMGIPERVLNSTPPWLKEIVIR